jgi:hypothetical protein
MHSMPKRWRNAIYSFLPTFVSLCGHKKMSEQTFEDSLPSSKDYPCSLVSLVDPSSLAHHPTVPFTLQRRLRVASYYYIRCNLTIRFLLDESFPCSSVESYMITLRWLLLLCTVAVAQTFCCSVDASAPHALSSMHIILSSHSFTVALLSVK